MLQCSQALHNGKPKQRYKLRQDRKPGRLELQTNGLVWTDMSSELRSAWVHEDDQNREHVIPQFKEQVTKNRQLTAYEAACSDRYDSDFTTNTQNSEGTYVFHALQA